MRIRDRLESNNMPPPLTIGPDARVAEAVSSMAEKNYGSIVVADEGDKVIGILTERDILKRLVNEGLDAKATKVSSIMTSEPRLAHIDDEIVEWMQTMTENRFRRIPVVDDDDRIMAVITQTDIVAYTWPVLMERARELATTTVKRNYPIFLIAVGVIIYSVFLIAVARAFLAG